MGERTEHLAGIVLRSVPYKDSLSMVSFLGPEGLFSFSARGIEKPTSKGHFLTYQLSCCDVLLSVSSDGKRLSFKEGAALSVPDIRDDLSRGIAYSLAAEATSLLVREEDGPEAFRLLSSFLEAMKRGEEPLTAAAAYLAQLTRLIGYGINVDGCAVCGRKENIVALSFQAGGFLCADHADFYARPGALYLKEIRFLSRVDLAVPFPRHLETDEAKKAIRDYARHLSALTGVELKSIKLLTAV